ncbi:glucokinase [Pelagirhabdus alkalitolerans]|uniref:Glucokinase n=1 Tax=Pelagirhabdus alkalitolerans TaxID=1612202 RepID=A0A1G6HZK6_9BACI|nr:ROK family glucokinase [Pelagirhabdus alkalitolerans]SDB99255.1 glucokinase [Pelagirhabdus alkalitolerans]
MKKYLFGVDIGGTTIKLGIISTEGHIIDKWEITTKKGDQSDQIPNDIWEALSLKMNDHQIDKNQVLGIGAGAPGFVMTETGVIAQAVNLGWIDFPLGELLKNLSGLPVYIDNDANIAALGENWLGSGDLAENLVAITLGTGVGGGIIANGQIVSGTNGMAGEIGHMTMQYNGAPCNCGRNGCLETIASATGIARITNERIDKYPNSILRDIRSLKGKVTAKDVFDAYKESDELATEVVNHITDVLGLAISNIATIVNPSKIVVGGGVSKAKDALLVPLEAAYKRYALPRIVEGSSFTIASLGNDAGIIGGAYLVKQHQL